MSRKSKKPRPHSKKGSAGKHDPLEPLRPEFDALVAAMQTAQFMRAADALFAADGKELGAIAQAHARTTAGQKGDTTKDAQHALKRIPELRNSGDKKPARDKKRTL